MEQWSRPFHSHPLVPTANHLGLNPPPRSCHSTLGTGIQTRTGAPAIPSFCRRRSLTLHALDHLMTD